MRFKISLLIFIVTCVSHVSLGVAHAEDLTRVLDVNAPPQMYTVENAPTLHLLFYSALSRLRANKDSNITQLFRDLELAKQKEGYTNLPQYSETILDYAKLVQSRGDDRLANEAVATALSLSPTAARVHVHAAALYEITGWRRALSNLLYGLSLSLHYPSLVFALMLNVLVLTLVAGTSALLLVVVMQFANHAEIIVTGFAKRISPRIGIAGSAALVAVLLIAPIAAGILAALLVGSVLLGAFVPKCRRLAGIVGMLACFWGSSLLLVDVCSRNVSEGIVRAVEDSARKSFSPDDAGIVTAAVTQDPSNALRLFAAGRLYERRGDDGHATQYYELALENTTDVSLRRAGQNNLGVLAFRGGKFDQARDYFLAAEVLGDASRELYTNLNLVYAALVDPEAQRNYFDKLRTRYPDAAMLSAEEAKTALSEEPPVWLLYREILHPNPETLPERRTKQWAVAHALLRGSNPVLLIVLGVVTLLAVTLLPLGRHRKNFLHHARPHERNTRTSLVWAAVPFGIFAAGKYPVAGACGVAAFFALIMLALDQPVRLFPVFEQSLPMTAVWLAFATLLFLISATMSYMYWRREKTNYGAL